MRICYPLVFGLVLWANCAFSQLTVFPASGGSGTTTSSPQVWTNDLPLAAALSSQYAIRPVMATNLLFRGNNFTSLQFFLNNPQGADIGMLDPTAPFSALDYYAYPNGDGSFIAAMAIGLDSTYGDCLLIDPRRDNGKDPFYFSSSASNAVATSSHLFAIANGRTNKLVIMGNGDLYWGANATIGYRPPATNLTSGQVFASDGGTPQQIYGKGGAQTLTNAGGFDAGTGSFRGNGVNLTNIPYAGVKGQLWGTNAVDGSISPVNTNFPLVLASTSFSHGIVLTNTDGDGSSLSLFADNGNPSGVIRVSQALLFEDTMHSQLATLDIGGTFTATAILGNGSGLTSLNASQLTSGTVGNARLSSPLNISGGNSNWFGGSVTVDTNIVSTYGQFKGNGSGLTNVVAVNTNYTTYAAGTAYTLTGTSAALTFGTTSPVLTIQQAGTYRIEAKVGVKYNGATYAGAQTITFKLRRTNNTAADLSNGSRAVELPVLTTFTGGDVMPLPTVNYTAVDGDTITIFGIVSATPAAGSVLADTAEIYAARIY